MIVAVLFWIYNMFQGCPLGWMARGCWGDSAIKSHVWTQWCTRPGYYCILVFCLFLDTNILSLQCNITKESVDIKRNKLMSVFTFFPKINQWAFSLAVANNEHFNWHKKRQHLWGCSHNVATNIYNSPQHAGSFTMKSHLVWDQVGLKKSGINNKIICNALTNPTNCALKCISSRCE